MLHMVGELNEQQKGYLQKILSGIENMSHLVNNLLDLGRIEAGVGLQLEKQPVDTVINRVFEDFQLHAAQKQVILSKEIPQQNLPVVEADHALLYQALQNLVDNALHYTKPGGEVIIGLKIHPDYVIYQVIDTGAGIAPADLPHIFEKFYRPAGKGVKIERGTGLGLAIVKSIADRHSGQVWVNSQLGVGSEFSLLIPLHQSHPE
jgi:two-component system NtrC family sensor kinase